MDRSAAIRRAILRSLDQCQGYLLAEDQLRYAVEAAVNPLPTRAEFDRELRALDSELMVAGLPSDNPLCRQNRWKICDAGRLALASP